jgi:hypothetical protein
MNHWWRRIGEDWRGLSIRQVPERAESLHHKLTPECGNILPLRGMLSRRIQLGAGVPHPCGTVVIRKENQPAIDG